MYFNAKVTQKDHDTDLCEIDMKKVLLVDDSKTMRMLVRRTLRQAGYELDIAEANDGAEGLTMIAQGKFDFVLSDWNMPNMTGPQMLKKLREDGNKIILGFVTSEGTEDMKLQALTLGASFLIVKPFTIETIQQNLDPVIKEGKPA